MIYLIIRSVETNVLKGKKYHFELDLKDPNRQKHFETDSEAISRQKKLDPKEKINIVRYWKKYGRAQAVVRFMKDFKEQMKTFNLDLSKYMPKFKAERSITE